MTKEKKPTKAVGTTMAFWIAQTLREQREAAGLSFQEIATAMEVHPITIERLEQGQTMGRDIAQAIAAYAYLLGLEDGRELWQMALDAWYTDGAPPTFKTEGPPGAFAQAIRGAALRQKQPEPVPSGTHSATRKSRAAQ